MDCNRVGEGEISQSYIYHEEMYCEQTMLNMCIQLHSTLRKLHIGTLQIPKLIYSQGKSNSI